MQRSTFLCGDNHGSSGDGGVREGGEFGYIDNNEADYKPPESSKINTGNSPGVQSRRSHSPQTSKKQNATNVSSNNSSRVAAEVVENRQPSSSDRERQHQLEQQQKQRRRSSTHGTGDSHFGDGRSLVNSTMSPAPSGTTRNSISNYRAQSSRRGSKGREEQNDNRKQRRSNGSDAEEDDDDIFDDDEDFEVDYDQGATELYRCIENKNWDAAMNRINLDPSEAATWVSRRESSGTGKLRWRLLPLHAVCIFRAPLALIEALIDAAPNSPQMKDDQGMLPIHLACRNGASKGVVLTLLEAFPESLYIRDRKARTLYDLVQTSNSQNKDSVLVGIQHFQEDLESYGTSKTQSEDPTERNGHDDIEQSISSSIKRSKSKSSVNSGVKPSSPIQMIKQSLSGLSKGSRRSKETKGNSGHGGKTPTSRSGNTQASPTPSSKSHNTNNIGTTATKLVQDLTVPKTGALVSRGSVLTQHNSLQLLEEPEVDYEHRTQLFRLILKKDWNAVVDRATMFPIECATWIVTKGFHGSLRFLPIHKACVLQPPESVINALIANYPIGVKQTDQDGWLPLHCAVFYGADSGVVDALIKANPKGCSWKDDDGRLPIHYVCLKGANVSVVESLLKAYPRAAAIKDDEGRLAIHHACSKGATPAGIDALLKSYPKGAQIKDEQGRLALHHAARKNCTERTIRALLTVYPRAAQIRDDQEKLPIHYACSHSNTKVNKETIQCLVTVYPESVKVENGFGHTPISEIEEALKNSTNTSAENTPNDPEVTRVLQDVLQLLQKVLRETMKSSGEIGAISNSSSMNRRFSGGQVSILEQRIAYLEVRIQQMEQCFSTSAHEIKTSLKKGKDPAIILEKLSRDFTELSISLPSLATNDTATTHESAGNDINKNGNNNKTLSTSTSHHQKLRNSTTPIKALFSRNKK